jgi:hypothetical protein
MGLTDAPSRDRTAIRLKYRAQRIQVVIDRPPRDATHPQRPQLVSDLAGGQKAIDTKDLNDLVPDIGHRMIARDQRSD